MSDALASALGVGFTMVVCLLAVNALLSPWLRLRRATRGPASSEALGLPAASVKDVPAVQ